MFFDYRSAISLLLGKPYGLCSVRIAKLRHSIRCVALPAYVQCMWVTRLGFFGPQAGPVWTREGSFPAPCQLILLWSLTASTPHRAAPQAGICAQNFFQVRVVTPAVFYRFLSAEPLHRTSYLIAYVGFLLSQRGSVQVSFRTIAGDKRCS